MKNNPNRRWYDTTRWRRAAKAFLTQNPLCIMCLTAGRVTPANTVDHVIPHKGDYDLFWNQENWSPLCAACHSAQKQTQELHGYTQAAGLDGQPIDKNHPWNR